MADLVVIVPSRGRPEAADELAQAFRDTCTGDTVLLLAVDEDDPRKPGYYGVVQTRSNVGWFTAENRTMVEALNRTAAVLVGETAADPPFAIGFMGDDHRPRSMSWDKAYVEALRELGTGIVYGNDLLQGANLPTQVAMTSDIVRALGWMVPPSLIHMYADNFWRDLGFQAGCLQYMPDVIIEHMHPVAGKAQWDEGHQRVNAPEMYQKDRVAYMRFCASGGFAEAVAKVKALRGQT